MADISVIIPTYKPGDYIWQCLDSLKEQTLAHDRYELIIIVNGCNEPYHSQIAAHLSSWPNALKTTIIQTDQGGVSNARNMGLDFVKGKYVCFIDDDDWVSPTYLEGLLSVVHGDDAMAIANVINLDERTGQMRGDWLSNCYNKNAKKPEQASLMSCRSFMSVACCKITACKAIGDYRFDTRYKQGEDALFNAEMSHRLKLFGVAPQDCIYYRRLRRNSAARSRSLWSITRDNAALAMRFSIIYLKGICHYSPIFFANRVLACAWATIREYLRPFKPDI
ncbi:MAG: glycosyltransferase family 2 protein [Bacteroidaceae bacterium]|nr:glycosyltransferase family 2 protein [Bacteroidaceae bacterium]